MFYGEILNLQEFKLQWSNPVSQERKPEQIKLVFLKEAVSSQMRNKLTDSKKLTDA